MLTVELKGELWRFTVNKGMIHVVEVKGAYLSVFDLSPLAELTLSLTKVGKILP